MDHSTIRVVLEATALASTGATILAGRLSARRPAVWAEGESKAAPWLHPLALFAFTCVLLYANQVLVNAYVLTAHRGDPSFVARYLPRGWFVLAKDDALVRFVAARASDGHVLAPSILYVQAFLELPFALLAYLAIARMLSSRLYAALTDARVIALASLSFTVTFCLVELSLQNPWTTGDLWMRGLSLVVTPIAIAWASARETPRDRDRRPRGVLGLLAFLAGAGAIAYVVLAVNDAFLFYNLGHLRGYRGGLAAASAIAAVATYASPRVDAVFAERPASTSIEVAWATLAAFTTVFFVPSLSIRYASRAASVQLCGAALIAAGALLGIRAVARARSVSLSRVVVPMMPGAIAGVVAAAWAVGTPTLFDELALARAAIAFLTVTIVGSRLVDLALPGEGPRGRGAEEPRGESVTSDREASDH